MSAGSSRSRGECSQAHGTVQGTRSRRPGRRGHRVGVSSPLTAPIRIVDSDDEYNTALVRPAGDGGLGAGRVERQQPAGAVDVDRAPRLERLARRAPRVDTPTDCRPRPSRRAGAAQRAGPAATGVDPVVGVVRRRPVVFCGPRAAFVRISAVPMATQARETVDRADGLVRRHTDDERQLDGVEVAEAGDVALVEQGAAERRVGSRDSRSTASSRSGSRGPHRSGPRCPTIGVLVGGGDDAEHRDVDPVSRPSPSTARPAAATPARGRRPDDERPVIRRWAYSVRPSSKRSRRCLPTASAPRRTAPAKSTGPAAGRG